MTDAANISSRKLPVLKFTIMLIVVTSILFPSIFAFIAGNQHLAGLISDILITFLIELVTAIFCYSIIGAMNRMLVYDLNRWWRYPVELVIVMGFGFVLLYTLHVTIRDSASGLPPDVKAIDYRLYITINQVGTLFIYILITIFNLYQQMLEKSALAEKMQKEYAQVRLQALKSQVNPHFLFNSLSVLSSLVHVNAETSEQFIIRLSKAYRYILEQKDIHLVQLKDELEFLDAYFFLLRIRFNDKITLDKQLHTDATAWQLPPLTLQLLVENAVKHNKMSGSEPLQIRVIAGDGRIVVENNCNPRDEKVDSTGIGLDNIRKRVAYLCNDPVIITPGEKIFRVEVPLIKKV